MTNCKIRCIIIPESRKEDADVGKNKNQPKLLKAFAQLLLAIAATIEAIANLINSLNR